MVVFCAVASVPIYTFLDAEQFSLQLFSLLTIAANTLLLQSVLSSSSLIRTRQV